MSKLYNFCIDLFRNERPPPLVPLMGTNTNRYPAESYSDSHVTGFVSLGTSTYQEKIEACLKPQVSSSLTPGSCHPGRRYRRVSTLWRRGSPRHYFRSCHSLSSSASSQGDGSPTGAGGRCFGSSRTMRPSPPTPASRSTSPQPRGRKSRRGNVNKISGIL